MDLTEQHPPSADSLPDQTDILLERVFVDYIRSGGAGVGSCSEPERRVVEAIGQIGSQYKDQFEEFYRDLDGRVGGLTTENASAAAEEFIGSCIGSGGGNGGCNWGRVAASLAFSRLVAGKLLADGEEGDFLEAYSTSVGKSLARFVREWRNREGRDITLDQLQTTNARISSSNRWTAGAFVSCFGAFVKVGAFAVTYANEAIR